MEIDISSLRHTGKWLNDDDVIAKFCQTQYLNLTFIAILVQTYVGCRLYRASVYGSQSVKKDWDAAI